MLRIVNASHFALASIRHCGPFPISITILCIIITITNPTHFQPRINLLQSWRSLLIIVHIPQKFRSLLQHIVQLFSAAHEFLSAQGISVIPEGRVPPFKIDRPWFLLERIRRPGKFRETNLCFLSLTPPALNVPA